MTIRNGQIMLSNELEKIDQSRGNLVDSGCRHANSALIGPGSATLFSGESMTVTIGNDSRDTIP